MAEISVEEKCKRLAGLIAQSPPGEVNDVINDIRAIVGDDEALMPHVLPSLRAYNLSQLHPVEHPAEDGIPEHVSLLSEAAVLPGSSMDGKERYVDAEGKRSFAFDHVTLAVSEYETYELPEEEATFRQVNTSYRIGTGIADGRSRAELYKSLSAYTKHHFPSGYCSVSTSQFPLLPPAPPPPAPAATTTSSAEEETTKPDAGAEAGTGTTAGEVEGKAEPAPTPAVGNVPEKKEEVDEPGGLDKVDEKVEEVKEEEEAAEKAEKVDETEAAPKADDDEVVPKEDETEPKKDEPAQEKPDPASTPAGEDESEATEAAGASETPAVVKEASVPLPERKQERAENPTYTLEIVGNRYNPPNFWTGRWRTQWVVDQAAGTVTGNIIVDVHYYEQGNVQLTTKHSASFPYPSQSGSQSISSQIVTNISKLETNYHLELNDVYSELGDKAFKALRRALPITRQKMDWEKVSGYTLGADLTKARA